HRPREGEGQFTQPFAAEGADLIDRPAVPLQIGPDELGEVASIGDVHLVEHDDARPAGQTAVFGQLMLERVDVRYRIALGFEVRAVDDVRQDRAALDVPEELQTEALSLRRSGDETRDIGDRVGRLAGGDDAE